MREIRVSGDDALDLATALLQRARLADPLRGVFEAADVQWWSRQPRRSDDVEKPFWVDGDGPVAGVLLTSWRADLWQCDPVVVPGAAGVDPCEVWTAALSEVRRHTTVFDVPVRDDDHLFSELARAELTGGDDGGARDDGTAWMDAGDRPDVVPPRDGFMLTDRTRRADVPHPFGARNGPDVEQRLQRCSLYDPELDLVVESRDGQVAGYSLYWFDPVTRVGLVEPVRVEDEFQRRGIARAMLTEGIARLVARGAERVKVSYESEAAAALYLGLGFQAESTATWYRSRSS